jgi:hypothetical protein
MRHYVAKAGLLFLVGGGCSLIYNADHIPVVADAKEFHDVPPPDSQIVVDANPMAVSFDPSTPVYPAAIDEGVGMFGSYPAIVALHGVNFVSTATVTFTPSTAVTLVEQKVSSDNHYIVLALQAPIDNSCVPPTTIAVMVTVSQPDGAGGTAMASLPNAFSVTCLRELTTVTSPLSSTTLDPKYSKIELASGITFGTANTETPAALLRSASHITISGDIVASAMGQKSGPGGGRGGDAAGDGSGPGAGAKGSSGVTGGGGGGAGLTAGGGAGSGNATGSGAGGPLIDDVFISSYAKSRASGGGGGGGALAGTGGAGGGGAGTVELTATGDVSVGSITASGGDGANSAGAAAGDGGAGAGGVVLVRTGGMLTLGTVVVDHGSPGNVSNAGGTGSVGRIRVDSATGAQAPSGGAIGPMFIAPPKTVTSYPTLNLRGLPNDHTAVVEVIDRDNNVVDNGHQYMPTFGPTTGTGTVQPVLRVGYNRVCIMVAGNTDPNTIEGTNCVEIGYAP